MQKTTPFVGKRGGDAVIDYFWTQLPPLFW